MRILKLLATVIAALSCLQSLAQIDITYCRAHWWLSPNSLFIKGSVATYLKPTVETINSIDFDLMGHLRVDSVVSHNQHLAFRHSANKLTITLPAAVTQGTTDSVVVYYHGELKSTGLGTIGTNRKMHTIWTLSAAFGARDWWPCRQNLYDKIDSMDIFVTCPIEYKVASNGVIVSDISKDDSRTTHYRERHPLNYYTIGVAVGKYNVSEGYSVLATGDTIPTIYYYWLSDQQKITHTLADIDSLMNIFSNYFMPYPFADEKYGQAMIGGSASIEHQTMSFIIEPDFAITAHELAHQWFGNYVTCKGWQNVWINEGFASFSELLAIERIYPKEIVRYWHDYTIKMALHAKGTVYITDTSNDYCIFDVPTTYGKGPMVVVMLRDEIDESAFRQGCQMFLKRFGNGFATIDDARQCFEQAADTSLADFFNRWIHGGGYPIFHVSYNTDKPDNVTIDIQQSAVKLKSTDPDFYPMHITVRLVGKRQKDVRLHLTSPQQQFVVPADFKVDHVIIDPDKVILGTWYWK
ncbi:MAG: M1 family metallopeptidase [Salinivirgaceae bacterium]|nr:M1 family metallopeptidase [Salinivirgaceae bacterium]